MFRRLLALLLALAATVPAFCQAPDSTLRKDLHAFLEKYTAAMEDLPVSGKTEECDVIIDSTPEGELRADVAMWLFDHYIHGPVMGEEAVAVAIYDKWLAGGKSGNGEDDLAAARMMTEFCRHSLVGSGAVPLTLQGLDGREVAVPGTGDSRDAYTVLYFYDTTCKTCQATSVLLRNILPDFQSLDITLIAVYAGGDRQAWAAYAASQLAVDAPNVTVLHAWDPECSSDYIRYYDVLGTPRLYLIDNKGIIQGRRLTVEALKSLLMGATVDAELHARVPEGSPMPGISVPATMVRGGGRGERDGVYKLGRKSLSGRTYVMFYTPRCSRCDEQKNGLLGSLRRRDRALLVNLEETDGELLRDLLDTFDLTVLPHILCTDRRGRVVAKYLDFSAGAGSGAGD